MPEHTAEQKAAIIAAAITEEAHNPYDIHHFIAELRSAPVDAVKALKAEKPYLFKPLDARKLTDAEYKEAKAATFRAIRNGVR